MIRILQFPAALAIVAAITLIYHKAVHVNATTVALTFLLAILAVSTFWGMAVAVTMSAVSMLAWNYYFLPPTGTLTISDPENWVALLAFLAVAIISSKLSTTARQQAADALAPLGLWWFEDICDPLDFETLAAVARRYTAPLAAGEALFSAALPGAKFPVHTWRPFESTSTKEYDGKETAPGSGDKSMGRPIPCLESAEMVAAGPPRVRPCSVVMTRMRG